MCVFVSVCQAQVVLANVLSCSRYPRAGVCVDTCLRETSRDICGSVSLAVDRVVSSALFQASWYTHLSSCVGKCFDGHAFRQCKSYFMHVNLCVGERHARVAAERLRVIK